MKVYIVKNCNKNSRSFGSIYAVFDNETAAKKYCDYLGARDVEIIILSVLNRFDA